MHNSNSFAYFKMVKCCAGEGYPIVRYCFDLVAFSVLHTICYFRGGKGF